MDITCPSCLARLPLAAGIVDKRRIPAPDGPPGGETP